MDISIETDRLWLRAPVMEDAEALFQHYARHPEVPKFLPWETHQNVNETREFLSTTIEKIQSGKSLHWILIPKELNEGIGLLGGRVHDIRAQLGYALGPKFWNKGYMSEAVRAVISYYFQRGDIWRVDALCDTENFGSAKVMEKAGMKREACLHWYHTVPKIEAGPRDSYLYAIFKQNNGKD